MVRFQTFLHSGFFVIIPLVKFPTAFVAYVFLFGRIVYHMIGSTTVLADAPAGHPGNQVCIRHADVDRSRQGNPQILQDLVQGNCLILRTGKPVQDESFGTIRLALSQCQS